ncbi:MAG: AAA family ATPase [Candidatus Aureabacteria bacterium]|nr:AAA family ATPase [Candidatus Auribacterota bacterium]
MRDILRILFKQKTFIIISFSIFFLLTLIKVFMFKPVYEATALLSFSLHTKPTDIEPEKIDIPESMKLVKSHKIKLTSRPVLKRIEKSLDLSNKEELLPPRFFVPSVFRKAFVSFFPEFVIDKDGYMAAKNPHDYTIKKLKDDVIVIEEIPFTNFLKVNAQMKDPELAASISNELAKEYILWDLDFQKAETENLLRFLKDEVSESSSRVEYFESEIEKFKQKKGLKISDISKSETGNDLENISVYEYQAQLNLKIKTSLLEKELKQFSWAFTDLLDRMSLSPAFLKMEENLDKLEMKRALLLKVFTENHPKVRAIDEIIANTKNSFIDIFLHNIKIDKNDRYAAEKLIAMKLDIFQLQKRTDVYAKIKNDLFEKNWVVKEKYMPEQEKDLNQLYRELRINESIYDFLVHEMEEARIVMAKNETKDIEIIQPAEIPTEPLIKPLHVLVFGFFISGILSFSLGWMIEFKSTTFGPPTHLIEKELGTTLLATLPYRWKILNTKFKINTDQQQSVRSLQAMIDSSDRKKKCLLITSSLENEGKTTVAVNLARLLALNGKKTLLIDCASFNKNSLLKTFSNGLSGDIKKELVHEEPSEIYTPKNEMFDFLFIDKKEEEIIKTISSDVFMNYMRKAFQHYDFILFDTPAISDSSVAFYLTNITDNVLLIVESERTRKIVADRAIKRLQSSGANVIGVLLNKVRYHVPDFIYKNLN